jgi:hypothetical protein
MTEDKNRFDEALREWYETEYGATATSWHIKEQFLPAK